MKIIITEKQLKLLKESEDESILLVGDSHTVDNNYTWSSMLKQKFKNVKILAIGGKRTSWMKDQLQSELQNKKYDKVVIWGGNNDAFSLTPNSQAIFNIQQMVDMVNSQGGTAYVIQGYDYRKFSNENKFPREDMKKFRKNYINFQDELASSIKKAIIIPKFNVDNSHAPDNIHGDSFAQKVVFNDVVNYLEKNPTVKQISNGNSEFNSEILNKLKKNFNSGINFETLETNDNFDNIIEAVQIALVYLGFGFPHNVSGKFDTDTKNLISDFQDSVKLETTGKLNYETIENLITKLNIERFGISSNSTQKNDEIVIKNPNVSVIKYPSDIMEKFKKIAENDYNEFISGCNSIGLDPKIAVRQLYTESGFSPNVINCSRKSSAGALGIAQFMPGTWNSYGVGSPCNVSDSLKAYIKLMGDNLKRFPNRPDLAVAAYNSGPNLKAYKNALDKNLDFTDLKGKIPNESYKYSASIFQA